MPKGRNITAAEKQAILELASQGVKGKDIAAQLGYTPSAITRLLKRERGMTTHAYRLRQQERDSIKVAPTFPASIKKLRVATEARQVVIPPTHCKQCQGALERLRWNTKGDILICRNLRCPLFYSPQRFFYEKRENMVEVLART